MRFIWHDCVLPQYITIENIVTSHCMSDDTQFSHLTPHSILIPPRFEVTEFTERQALYQVLSALFPSTGLRIFAVSRSTETLLLSLTNSFFTMIIFGESTPSFSFDIPGFFLFLYQPFPPLARDCALSLTNLTSNFTTPHTPRLTL